MESMQLLMACLVHEDRCTTHAAPNAHACAEQRGIPPIQLRETSDNLAGAS